MQTHEQQPQAAIHQQPQDKMLAALEQIKEVLLLQAHETKRHSSALWDTQMVADALGLSKASVQQKVVNSPGFPAPRILPTGGRRWLAKEVMAWIEKRR